MTGRQLYDALCDSWAQEPRWSREQAPNLLRLAPLAWSFLAQAERSALNATARRLTPPKRK